ncbi:hypothetical protein NA78x_003900 [Anatilimnocola sp. NA78]|uniref:hypothetical protein n=1 Tax=Anatilimnocola sp. NA78 TaxID=3415683 RepID=UPI003CE4AF7C
MTFVPQEPADELPIARPPAATAEGKYAAFAFYAFLVVIAIVGCSSREPTYPVTGKVVFKDDGTPAATGVTVVFESTKKPYARSAGVIQPDGTFVLSTDRPDNGAMAGEHRVSISRLAADGSGRDLTAQLSRTIDPKYLEFRTSNLVLDIQTRGPNEFTIPLERPKK